MKVEILAKENVAMPSGCHFTGVIFKDNVRDFDKDHIEMHKCFLPNDIIKAKVI